MGMREYNGVLRQKCKAFAIRIVKLYQYVSTEKKETVMSKQLLRAGTAIGALQREGEHAESKLNFIHKYAIAQKEHRRNTMRPCIGWNCCMRLLI